MFVLLALVIIAGGFITFFGVGDYTLYSGTERNFNYLSNGELHNKLLVKGDIELVTKELGTERVAPEFLGMPIGKTQTRKYYALPLGYSADKDTQQYCVIAVTGDEDISAVDALLKSSPAPRDPNAPRFEFRGIVMDLTTSVSERLYEYLWGIYDTDFNFYSHHNVKRNIVPYIIFVRTTEDGGFAPIIIGVAVMLAGGALMTLLAVNTYRKNRLC